MFTRALALVLIAAMLVACGPIPGGSLAGTLEAPPSDWSSVLDGDRAFCEIESRPNDPHSIQLECFIDNGDLYVQSHRWALSPWWPTTSWAMIWLDQPDVQVRVGASLFELLAVHITDSEKRKRILESRGYDPVPEGIALFRFAARSAR